MFVCPIIDGLYRSHDSDMDAFHLGYHHVVAFILSSATFVSSFQVVYCKREFQLAIFAVFHIRFRAHLANFLINEVGPSHTACGAELINSSIKYCIFSLFPLAKQSEFHVFSTVASSDASARLWTMATGEVLRVYQGHHKAAVCCALHDGAESSSS